MIPASGTSVERPPTVETTSTIAAIARAAMTVHRWEGSEDTPSSHRHPEVPIMVRHSQHAVHGLSSIPTRTASFVFRSQPGHVMRKIRGAAHKAVARGYHHRQQTVQIPSTRGTSTSHCLNLGRSHIKNMGGDR